jgi:hypothetical protein
MKHLALLAFMSSPALASSLPEVERHVLTAPHFSGQYVKVCIEGEGCIEVDRTLDAMAAFDIPRNEVAAQNDSGSVFGQSDLALPATIIADTISKSLRGSGTVVVKYKTKETKPDGSSKETSVEVEVSGSVGKTQK